MNRASTWPEQPDAKGRLARIILAAGSPYPQHPARQPLIWVIVRDNDLPQGKATVCHIRFSIEGECYGSVKRSVRQRRYRAEGE